MTDRDNRPYEATERSREGVERQAPPPKQENEDAPKS